MSEDRDRRDRLSGSGSPGSSNGEGSSISIRVETDTSKNNVEESLRRAKEQARQRDDVVREYQEKYYGANSDTARKRKRAEELAEGWKEFSRKVNWQPQSFPVDGLTEDERLWAALAHVATLLTLGVAIITNGFGALLMVFAPLAIYFAFRDRSEFVGFQALQAFAVQLIATVGWVAVLIVGVLVLVFGIVISALASIVLVGIPFLVLFILLLVVFVLFMVALPFGMLILSLIAAYSTYNGNEFRYPIIANWIDRQQGSSL